MIFRGHRYLSHSGKWRVNFREKGTIFPDTLGHWELQSLTLFSEILCYTFLQTSAMEGRIYQVVPEASHGCALLSAPTQDVEACPCNGTRDLLMHGQTMYPKSSIPFTTPRGSCGS